MTGFIIEGLAIVSADGMIADAAGVQPDALKLEADQLFFHERVRAADVLVHGRNSGEGGADEVSRRRVILTRRVSSVARDPENGHRVLWNPAGSPFEAACALFGIHSGRAVVIGGTEAFGLFLPSYGVFHLSRTGATRLPKGRPVFPGVPEVSPEDMLARQGLKPDATRVLDRSADLTLTTWRR